jgi:hypothetical protein
MIKMLRPDDIWQPKLGAPNGNRNARKHGRRDTEAMALRHRIAQLRRRAKALLARAGDEIAKRQAPTNSRPSTPAPIPAHALHRAAETPS